MSGLLEANIRIEYETKKNSVYLYASPTHSLIGASRTNLTTSNIVCSSLTQMFAMYLRYTFHRFPLPRSDTYSYMYVT